MPEPRVPCQVCEAEGCLPSTLVFGTAPAVVVAVCGWECLASYACGAIRAGRKPR